MTDEQKDNPPNNRITTQQFYDALLKNKDEISLMERRIKEDILAIERRISDKIDCVPGFKNDIDDLQEEVKDLRRKTYVWDGLNSIGVIVGSVIAALTKPH